MKLDFVNQRMIRENTYIAYRDADAPQDEYVTKNGGEPVLASLKEVWFDDVKLEALFNGN